MTCNYKNNSDFEYACNFFEKNFTQSELWSYLDNGSDLEKQLATLKIETVQSENQAQILVNNLTGVDGKIREAISAKIKCFLDNPAIQIYFLNKEFYPIYLDAIIDINGNICRNIIDGLKNIANDAEFSTYMLNEIIKRSLVLCEKIKNFDYKTRKYVTNKEIFKLYWYLTTLAIFNDLPQKEFYKLAHEVCEIEEYTVREKLAILISKLPLKEQEQFVNLNSDNNIYIVKALKKYNV